MVEETNIQIEDLPIHPWLQNIHLVFVPGPMTSMLEEVSSNILRKFEDHGHVVQEEPNHQTDLILTTARFGEVVGWREALLFTSRKRYKLDHTPTVVTLMQAAPNEFKSSLNRFEEILEKEPPDPKEYDFPGLAPESYRVLFEQGRRGGPIMALERLLQSQTKSIRILLVVGKDKPEEAYHFDLVGAYPRSEGVDEDAFYNDIVLRLVTGLSTHEITQHKVIGDLIPRRVWDGLATPEAMRYAAKELGKRNFFTEMVRISDLVNVPAVESSVSSQYSEGCFATWDHELGALIATVTGSARPVDKDNITEADLAVIVGVREDGQGAVVRHVEDKQNDPPSSEAVELMDMDFLLPQITWESNPDTKIKVPVVRSKLHGHRGISAYDPEKIEYVPLDQPYFHFPVSCATEAQAKGIKAAFARSESLNNPDDPRKVAFTVLPCHGVVIVEKWVRGKVPFQVIWEYMDDGSLEVDNYIPQGPMGYRVGSDGRHFLENGNEKKDL